MGHVCTSSLGACGDINLVFGLEAKRSGGGEGGRTRKEPALSCMVTTSRGRYSSFLGQCRVHPSEGVGRSLPLGVQKLFPVSKRFHQN